jgi:hypothetical protein
MNPLEKRFLTETGRALVRAGSEKAKFLADAPRIVAYAVKMGWAKYPANYKPKPIIEVSQVRETEPRDIPRLMPPGL